MTDSATLKKALYAIKKLKQQLSLQKNKPIAVIGIGCRFPGAMNKNEYWDLLSQGKNIISPIPEKRWQLLKNSAEALIQTNAQHCAGGFFEDIAAFDAYFFGISPREAMRMDPQQRFLLEVAYEAIEDAGIPVETLAGSNTGVFTSLYASQFAYMQKLDSDQDALYIPTGNAVSIAANRLSYFFDLHGPSIVFDTACSSSLVALHHACLNLQNNLCDLALVSAANINLQPSMNLLLLKAKMLSPAGQCKTFDATADGYVQGEGVGVIVLKPLAAALQDNNRIYALITGSALNQDGQTNGLTAPNGAQQEDLLRMAYRAAQCHPHDISYVECHGTGTFLGDPIEVEALGKVLSQERSEDNPCWIGSVKTNIGHLEPAAGIASIIKVALALQQNQIPPHLNFAVPNPHIAFDQYHFRVPQALTAWPKQGPYRIAGISGFGFGGTNAHIVMRELTEEEKITSILDDKDNGAQLFTVSAKDPAALKILISTWCQFLEKNKSIDLATLCYNVQVRRSHYFYRLAILVKTIDELQQILSQLNTQALENIAPSEKVFINTKKDKIQSSTQSSENNLTTLTLSYINRDKIYWKNFHADKNYPSIDMPHYPWQHHHYWPVLQNTVGAIVTGGYPFLRKQIASPLETTQFEFQFDVRIMPEIQDTFHFLHIGYYLEMLAFVVEQLYQWNSFSIENLEFISALSAPPNTVITVQVILEKKQDQDFFVTFHSYAHDHHWVQHATCHLLLQSISTKKIDPVDEIKKRCFSSGTEALFYERVKAMRMPGEGSIRWGRDYWLNDHEMVCQFSTPDSARKKEAFKLKIHLGIFDACVQSLFMLLPNQFLKPYVASRIKKLTYFGYQNQSLHVFASMKNVFLSGEQYTGNFYLIDNEGALIAECEELQMTQLNQNMRLGEQSHAIKIELQSSTLTLEERQQKINAYLIQQIALLLSMPEEDIDTQQSLRNMGVDSLMAMALSTMIEADLETVYPAHAILKGPTIVDISDFVLNQPKNKKIENNAHAWIAFRKKSPSAKSRLFCFPYGGGGASIYSEWQKNLPDSIEVCPIQLPGREERMQEPSIDQFDPLIKMLMEHLQGELDLPFAFFGHSFGALIAFELTRALRKHHLPQPLSIFVSAFPDPIEPTRSLDNLISQLLTIHVNLFELNNAAAISALSAQTLNHLATIFRDNGLVEYGNVAMSADIIKILLPIFIGDMRIVKNYQYREEPPLNLPITVFLGTRDTWVPYDDHLGWSAHTQKKCDIHSFESGHLFIKDPQIRIEVLKKISNVFVGNNF